MKVSWQLTHLTGRSVLIRTTRIPEIEHPNENKASEDGVHKNII